MQLMLPVMMLFLPRENVLSRGRKSRQPIAVPFLRTGLSLEDEDLTRRENASVWRCHLTSPLGFSAEVARLEDEEVTCEPKFLLPQASFAALVPTAEHLAVLETERGQLTGRLSVPASVAESR